MKPVKLPPPWLAILFPLCTRRLVALDFVGNLCVRRAQQAHQTLDVRGRTGHQLLDQHFPLPAVAGSPAAVTVHHFPQLALDLWMFATHGGVLRRSRLVPRTLVLGLVVRLADRTPMP